MKDAEKNTSIYIDHHPVDPNGAEVVFEYKELTDKTVKLSNAAPFELENVAATASETKLEMAQM